VSGIAASSSFCNFSTTPGVLHVQYRIAHEVFDVVSEPAINCVRASAVSSARPSFWPDSSFPSMRRASKSIRSASCFPSSRAETRATAIPARFSTAAMPLLKNGSGRYFA
jgi:hypothetical protein